MSASIAKRLCSWKIPIAGTRWGLPDLKSSMDGCCSQHPCRSNPAKYDNIRNYNNIQYNNQPVNNPATNNPGTKPVNNQSQPVKNQYQAVNNQYQPIRNQYQPVNNQYQPVDNQYQPVNNQYKPVNNQYKPVSNQYQPTRNQYQPSSNQNQPIYNKYGTGSNQYQPVNNQYQYQQSTNNQYYNSKPTAYQYPRTQTGNTGYNSPFITTGNKITTTSTTTSTTTTATTTTTTTTTNTYPIAGSLVRDMGTYNFAPANEYQNNYNSGYNYEQTIYPTVPTITSPTTASPTTLTVTTANVKKYQWTDSYGRVISTHYVNVTPPATYPAYTAGPTIEQGNNPAPSYVNSDGDTAIMFSADSEHSLKPDSAIEVTLEWSQWSQCQARKECGDGFRLRAKGSVQDSIPVILEIINNTNFHQ